MLCPCVFALVLRLCSFVRDGTLCLCVFALVLRRERGFTVAQVLWVFALLRGLV